MIINLPIIGSRKNYCINPKKIIAVGLNYSSHIAESASIKVKGLDGKMPDEPVFFNKTPNTLIGPDQNIILPLCLSDYSWTEPTRTDYEGELVVIISQQGKHIAEKDAYSHIFGYTCGNDVSQRNIQNTDRAGWFRGKSFDTFGPVGPQILPGNTRIDPHNLQIETRLNGKVVQSSHTSRMIFSIPELISYISRHITLDEGDLIFTGTPSGVGPLKPNDCIEVEIENIGVLNNTVVNEEDQFQET